MLKRNLIPSHNNTHDPPTLNAVKPLTKITLKGDSRSESTKYSFGKTLIFAQYLKYVAMIALLIA